MNILVVDDTEANRKLLRVTLGAEGFTIFEAADGVEGLAVLEKSEVHLIISDILMPNMDGYRFCFEVRRNPHYHLLPLIFYTSTYNSPGDEELALDLGADRYLKKPASLKQIVEMINELTLPGYRRPDRHVKPLHEVELMMSYSKQLVVKLEKRNADLGARTEQLLQSEERFRQLAENIDEVLFITTSDMNNFIYVSPAYERIWGKTSEKLDTTPRGMFDTVQPEDRTRLMAQLQALQNGAKIDVEFRILRPDRTERWIHARGFPILDQNGKVYRVAGVATDLTERRSLENQIARMQRLESIGTLASGIAHDLNNVLAPILMAGKLLESRLLEKRDRDLLGTVNRCAQRGADIVRQILTFTRGTEGKRSPTQVSHLVREIAGIVTETFPKDIHVAFDIEHNLPIINCDPTQIHQVLLNLCVNARDAMPRGGELRLEAKSFYVDENYAGMCPDAEIGNYVRLSVSDTGSGIPAELLGRIFEPFFTTKELGAGTGLGLSTTRSIIISHQGFVAVKSESGKGAVFNLHLPTAPKPDAVAQRQTKDIPMGHGEVILVVDDEAAFRDIAKLSLETFGYKVLLAADGADAVAMSALNHGGIAMALVDMMMPIMDGPATIRTLQKLDPAIRFIVTSGHLADGSSAEVISTRVKAFLGKPYTADELLIKIHEVLAE